MNDLEKLLEEKKERIHILQARLVNCEQSLESNKHHFALLEKQLTEQREDLRELLGRIEDCQPSLVKTCPTHGTDCGFLKKLRAKYAQQKSGKCRNGAE